MLWLGSLQELCCWLWVAIVAHLIILDDDYAAGVSHGTKSGPVYFCVWLGGAFLMP
jgi:hypothetical protein